MATGGAPKTQIVFTAEDATAEGLQSIGANVDKTTARVIESADRAAGALDGIGAAGEENAQRLDKVSSSIAQSLRRATSDAQREVAALQSTLRGGAGAGSADAFDNLIKNRSGDAAALQPMVDKLREVRAELDKLRDVESRAMGNANFRQQEAEANAMRNRAEQTRLFTQVLDDLDAKERQVASNKAFITSLQEQSAAIGKTRADLLELKAAQLGLGNDAAPYIAQLRAQEQAMVRTTKSVNEFGKSQGELKAAMRNVPAQFTDIVVSLQSGQQPLTVLLQQGGQLKDMFGGLGPAIRAIGGYALGLVNPFTAAAAAVGVLGVAYYKGSQEQDEYQKVLLKTGNIAGTTVGQMQMAAKEAATISGDTAGKAAEIITALASTGSVAGDNFSKFTASIISANKYLDISIKDSVSAFNQLGEEPVKASKKLNTEYNFLTTSVYEQIKALEEQGRKQEAAEVAQRSLSSALDARSNAAKASLGTFQRAWESLGTEARLAWDKILNIGRAATVESSLASMQAELKRAEDQVAATLARAPNWDVTLQREGIAKMKAQIDVLSSDARQQVRAAEAQANMARDTQTGMGYESYIDATKTKAQKAKDEIDKMRAAGEALIRSGGKLTQEQLEKDIEAYKKKNAESTKGADRAALGRDKELADIQARIDATTVNTERLKEYGTVADKVTEGKIAADKIEKQLAGAEAKRMDKATRSHLEQMLALNKELDVRQQAERNEKQRAEAIERTVKAQEKAVDAANKESDAIERQNESLRANIDAHGRSAIAIAKANLARAQASFNEADSSDSFPPEMVAARQRGLEAAREQLALTKELDYSKVNEQIEDQLAISKEQNRMTRDDISLIGMTESERRKVLAVRQIELRLAKELQKIDNMEIDEPDKEKLRAKERQKALVDAETAAMRETASEWTKYFDDINHGMGDAIETAIFDGSKEGAKKMREVLQEALLRKPLRMVIDAVMNQVTGGIANLVLGGTGGAGGAAGGGASGLGNAASLASSVYDFSQGTGALYNAYGAVSAYAGLTNTAAATYLSHPLAGIATQGSISGFGAGSGAAATGSGLGAAATGGIVTAIMLAFINAFGGMRTETMIGSGLAGTLGGANSLTPWQEWREGGTLFDGPSFATHNPLEELDIRRAELQRLRDSGQGENNYAVAIQAVVTDLEKTTKGLAEQTAVFNREIGKGYKAFRTNVVQMADSLGLAGSSIENFAYELGAQDLNFQGLKPEEIQAKIQETFGKAGTEMAQQLLGSFKEVTDTVVNTYVTEQRTQNNEGAFQTDTTVTKRMEYQASVYAKTGETALDTLTRLATSFNTLNETADALGFGIQKGSLALGKFADDFIEAFGGLERFTASTGAFLQNYYNDEERRQALLRAGARQAENLGIKGVTAESLEQLGRDGIRAFVNSLSSSPEAYADAIDLANFISPAFEAIDAAAPEAEKLADTVDELTQSFTNAVKTLKAERLSLLADLARAKGDEVGARRIERQTYLDSFVDEAGNKLDEVRLAVIAALYDGNIALKDEVDLRKQITDLTQTNAQALASQREALTESNRALFDQVQALTAIKAIAEKLPVLGARTLNPQQRLAVGYDKVASDLGKEGFQGVSGAALAGMSINQLTGLFTAVYNLGTTSDQTRLVLIDAADALLNLRQEAAGIAADALESAYDSLERATDKERERLEKVKDNIESVFDTLDSNVRELYKDVKESRDALAREGLRFINEAYQTALTGGGLPDNEKLGNAIGDVRAGMDGTAYATQFEADKARLLLAGKLSTLQDIAGDQLTETEQQLKALEDQLVESRQLVDTARKQLDATYQGTKATGSIADAIAELARALVNADTVSGIKPPTSAGRVVEGTNGSVNLSTGVGTTEDGLSWAVKDVAAAAEAALIAGQTKQVYDVIEKSGFTLKQAEAIFNLPAGSAEEWARSMGYKVFHSGINFVPETGLALLERGERVVRAADNPYGAGASKATAQSERDAYMIALLERIAQALADGREVSEEMLALWNQVTAGGNEMAVGVMNGSGRPVPTKVIS